MRICLFTLLFIGITGIGHSQLCPAYSIGPDTTIGCGASVTLQAPAGYNNYSWNTGATSSSISVAQGGIYHCTSVDTLANVVVNGDFGMGMTGFQSDYIPGPGGPWGPLSNAGTYGVAVSPNILHTSFAPCVDHTLGNGTHPMLVVNGASVPNQRVWYQTVNVQQNTTYIFSVWFTSVISSSPAILQFSINNSPLGNPFMLSSTTCLWQNFFTTWNSGANTTATISILNQNFAGGGNDFAIDDILFAPICVQSDTLVVTQAVAPVVSVTGGDTICAGDSITLTAQSNIPGSSFLWSPGNETTQSITVGPASDAWYYVVAEEHNCFSDPDSTQVVIAPGFTTAINGPSAVCPFTLSQLDAVVNGGWGNIVLQWLPGNLNGPQITVSSGSTTTYSLITEDQCMRDSVAHTIIIHPDPDPVVAIANNFQCAPLCTGFDLTTGTSLQSVSWNFGDGGTSQTEDPQHCYQNAGLYDVNVSVQDINGCTGSLSLPALIEVYATPTASFTVAPLSISLQDSSLEFSNTSSGGQTYSWNFGDGSSSSAQSPVHVYSPSSIGDQVVVQLIVYSTEGCSDTAWIIIPVLADPPVPVNPPPPLTFFMPNSFTPNNDGINDLFHGKGYGVHRMIMQIYNRWGQEVFYNDDMFAGWDGVHQFSGVECPEGVYVYRVDIQDIYMNTHQLIGKVVLVR